MSEQNVRSSDQATLTMIDLAGQAGIATAWDRLASQQPQCKFGKLGVCCRNCFMGPCRVMPGGRGAQGRHLRCHGRDDCGKKPPPEHL